MLVKLGPSGQLAMPELDLPLPISQGLLLSLAWTSFLLLATPSWHICLLLLQNWGLLELPTGRGEEQELHIFYTMLPCLTIFGNNPRTPLGADFMSARCLSPAYSDLVQEATGLDMHDVRLSGHPVVSQRCDDDQPLELLFLVHHSWRQHGGAAHWVVLVHVETWQVGTTGIMHRCNAHIQWALLHRVQLCCAPCIQRQHLLVVACLNRPGQLEGAGLQPPAQDLVLACFCCVSSRSLAQRNQWPCRSRMSPSNLSSTMSSSTFTTSLSTTSSLSGPTT